MAFNDTLFQLGMDLTRSSPAQTEELGEAALFGAQSDVTAKSANIETGHRSAVTPFDRTEKMSANPSIGTHVTIDIHGDVGLYDFKTAVATLTRLVDDAGASLLHLHVQPILEGGAVSGVAVLDAGHISFHSRPKAGYAALDISTFGGSAPDTWTLAAKSAFEQARISARVHTRGERSGSGLTGEGTAGSLIASDSYGTSTGGLLSAVLPSQRPTRSSGKTLRARAA